MRNQIIVSSRLRHALRALKYRSKGSFFSESGEDHIASYLIGSESGTFLDIGSGNPVVGSNTYYFYKKGWRGIGVDANSNLSLAWKLVRPKDEFINAAVNGSNKPITFFEFENDLKSTVVEKVSGHYLLQGKKMDSRIVNSISLNELLPTSLSSTDNYFLSIDVEGAELDVLQSANLETKRPRLIAVESWTVPWSPKNKVSKHLKNNLFELVGYSGLTAFYIPSENFQILMSNRFDSDA